MISRQESEGKGCLAFCYSSTASADVAPTEREIRRRRLTSQSKKTKDILTSQSKKDKRLLDISIQKDIRLLDISIQMDSFATFLLAVPLWFGLDKKLGVV